MHPSAGGNHPTAIDGDRFCDRARGEFGERRDEIFARAPQRLRLFPRLRYELRAELFASRGLWRTARKIRIATQACKKRCVDRAARCDLTVAVKTWPLGKKQGDCNIDRHVAGAGVKSKHVRRCAARRQPRDVGDSSDVEGGARFLRASNKKE